MSVLEEEDITPLNFIPIGSELIWTCPTECAQTSISFENSCRKFFEKHQRSLNLQPAHVHICT